MQAFIWRTEPGERNIGGMRSLIAALLLVGCTHSTAVMAPDGAWAYQVTCKRSLACLDECARLCPRGYIVLGSDQQAGAVAQSYSNAYGQTTTVVTPNVTTEALIRCRGVLGGSPTD